MQTIPNTKLRRPVSTILMVLVLFLAQGEIRNAAFGFSNLSQEASSNALAPSSPFDGTEDKASHGAPQVGESTSSPKGTGAGYLGKGLPEHLAKRWIAETLKKDTLIFSPVGTRVQIGKLDKKGNMKRRELTADEFRRHAEIIRVVQYSTEPQRMEEIALGMQHPRMPHFDNTRVLIEMQKTEIFVFPDLYTVAGGFWGHAASGYGKRAYFGGELVKRLSPREFTGINAQENLHHAINDPDHWHIRHKGYYLHSARRILRSGRSTVMREQEEARILASDSLRKLVNSHKQIARRSMEFREAVQPPSSGSSDAPSPLYDRFVEKALADTEFGNNRPIPRGVSTAVLFIGKRVFVLPDWEFDLVKEDLSSWRAEDLSISKYYREASENEVHVYWLRKGNLRGKANRELRDALAGTIGGGYMAIEDILESPEEAQALDREVAEAFKALPAQRSMAVIRDAMDPKLQPHAVSVIVVNADDPNHHVNLREAVQRVHAGDNVRIVLMAQRKIRSEDGVRSAKGVLEKLAQTLGLPLDKDYLRILTHEELVALRQATDPLGKTLVDYARREFGTWARSKGQEITARNIGYVNSATFGIEVEAQSSGILEVALATPSTGQAINMDHVIGFTELALRLRQSGQEDMSFDELIDQLDPAQRNEFAQTIAALGITDTTEVGGVRKFLEKPVPAAVPSDISDKISSFKSIVAEA